MPRKDREFSRGWLKQNLLMCGFSNEETDQSVLSFSGPNLTSLNVYQVAELVSLVQQKFEVEKQKFKAEKQELEKDLKAVRQSNIELFSGEMQSHMELIAGIRKVIEESEAADKARRMDYSHEQTGTMLCGMIRFNCRARDMAEESDERPQGTNGSLNHSETHRPVAGPTAYVRNWRTTWLDARHVCGLLIEPEKNSSYTKHARRGRRRRLAPAASPPHLRLTIPALLGLSPAHFLCVPPLTQSENTPHRVFDPAAIDLGKPEILKPQAAADDIFFPFVPFGRSALDDNRDLFHDPLIPTIAFTHN